MILVQQENVLRPEGSFMNKLVTRERFIKILYFFIHNILMRGSIKYCIY